MEKKRILVIDDDELIQYSCKKILESEGYTVDTAATGKEAIQKSMADFYNLALIDIRLPDMEGTKLLTELHETVPKMKKIIVTGYPSQNNAIEALNKAADGYIIKPIVNTDDFVQTIKQHLKKQEEERKYSEDKVAEFVESRVREEETKQK
jgi:DNA-binding NtrC family response regulator